METNLEIFQSIPYLYLKENKGRFLMTFNSLINNIPLKCAFGLLGFYLHEIANDTRIEKQHEQRGGQDFLLI